MIFVIQSAETSILDNFKNASLFEHAINVNVISQNPILMITWDNMGQGFVNYFSACKADKCFKNLFYHC